jgi:hypothetical protein
VFVAVQIEVAAKKTFWPNQAVRNLEVSIPTLYRWLPATERGQSPSWLPILTLANYRVCFSRFWSDLSLLT